MYKYSSRRQFLFLLHCIVIALILIPASIRIKQLDHVLPAGPIARAFQQAASDFGVPVDLLKALCYMEGQFSIHRATPNTDGGYGCNLTKNRRIDTLDRAAQRLGVSPTQLQRDLRTNIRGAAYILSEDARLRSQSHALPSSPANWQEALELYSNARSLTIAHLYADEVYTLLKQGFSAPTDRGEVITVAPQSISMQASQLAESEAIAAKTSASAGSLPKSCSKDGKTDYPGAIDCILRPAQHDCDLVPGTNSPCNYFSSSHFGSTYRQSDHTITHIVIHNAEGTAMSALRGFAEPKSNVSSHYVVDSDGTVYQVVREKDVAFHAGNFWYNQHSIGIEHAGYDATGFLWYNATMYLASAQLVAYLLKKYHIPLDHNHIVSHGTIPALMLASTPNHVDPGPYWLWDYYLNLIRAQPGYTEVPFVSQANDSHIIVLHPQTDGRPFGQNGTETPANFNFSYLFKGPSTQSGLIPQEGTGSDVTDETNTVEPDISYYAMKQAWDEAGTGDTMYEIWYGETDQAHANTPNLFTHARLAWLAAPTAAASSGTGTIVKLVSANGSPIQFSSKPGANTARNDYHIGDAPKGSTFVSGYTALEDGTNNLWYEINYNHRQAWIPASKVIVQRESPPIQKTVVHKKKGKNSRHGHSRSKQEHHETREWHRHRNKRDHRRHIQRCKP